MKTRPFDRATKQTPWDHAQTVREFPKLGITEVSTAGHGGYFLTEKALEKLPQSWIDYGASWSHGWGAGWFEEDCAALAVLCAYPEIAPHHELSVWASIERSARTTFSEVCEKAEAIFAAMPHKQEQVAS